MTAIRKNLIGFLKIMIPDPSPRRAGALGCLVISLLWFRLEGPYNYFNKLKLKQIAAFFLSFKSKSIFFLSIIVSPRTSSEASQLLGWVLV